MTRKRRRVMYAGKPVKPQGEWPMLEPMPLDDEAIAAGVAVDALGSVPARPLDGTPDDLTPSTLLGEHRPG
ncbi:MAG TPA: hypothetical protein VHE37_05155 [Nevskiaceae bacterium]|nr:hypothetical protein [Nevskiaceae bacterium]